MAGWIAGEGSLIADTAAAQPDSTQTPIWVLIAAACAAVLLLGTPVGRLGRGVRLGWRFTWQAGLWLVLSMLVVGMIGSVVAAWFGASFDELAERLVRMCGNWGGQAIVVLLAVRLGVVQARRRETSSHHRASLGGAMAMGTVGLALFWPLSLAVAAVGARVQAAISGEAPSHVAHGLLGELAVAGPGTASWLMVLAVIVGPALFEEILYRGCVQESLRRQIFGSRHAAWGAILLTSLFFTGMHVGIVETHALPALFVLSMGFGWAVARTGRLAAGVTMHLLFNAGNILMAVPWVTS